MTTTTTRARYLHLSPSSIKTRFAYRFLRALRKLNQQKKPNSRKQYHRVKLAAYASMASAVGAKRAWSRALLWKIRNRNLMKKKRRCYVSENPREEIGFVELRKLVPGGEVMDFDNLLDESADYIKCLASQLLTCSLMLSRVHRRAAWNLEKVLAWAPVPVVRIANYVVRPNK